MTKKNGREKCAITSCERSMEMPESGLCKTCYAGMHYWRGRSVTAIMKRQKQLAVLEERMELMGANRRQR